jgi:hypothetical protein
MASDVPSPLHQALSALYTSIRKDQAAMASALKDASQRLNAGDAWVGYAADAWNTDLTGRSGDLASNVNATVADVASALAATPATCPPAQADTERRVLAGRLQ